MDLQRVATILSRRIARNLGEFVLEVVAAQFSQKLECPPNCCRLLLQLLASFEWCKLSH